MSLSTEECIWLAIWIVSIGFIEAIIIIKTKKRKKSS